MNYNDNKMIINTHGYWRRCYHCDYKYWSEFMPTDDDYALMAEQHRLLNPYCPSLQEAESDYGE